METKLKLKNIEREKNKKLVIQYLNTVGEDRLLRYLLFDDEGYGGLWTTDTGEPIMLKGREVLKKHAVWSLKCFPDWVWYNVKVFETTNPKEFWVECDGKGTINFEAYNKGIYENHFLHYFKFNSNNKIIEQKEFMNPCMQYKALGIELPKINRIGIPK